MAGPTLISSFPSGPRHCTSNDLVSSDRIVGIDIVRGFALFGVLLVNMYSFGADSIAWNAAPDRLCFLLKHVFFESKSWTLFSLLFGVSFATLIRRWPAAIATQHMLRRLLFLLGLGSLHALLYDGDILRLYAELGLVLLFVCRLRTRWLLLIAGLLLAAFPLVHAVTPDREPDDLFAVDSVEEAREELLYEQEESVYAIGSFSDVIAYHAEDLIEIPWADAAWPDSGLTVLGLFLLGVCLARSPLLKDHRNHLGLLRRVAVVGLTLGLACAGGEALLGMTVGYDAFRLNQAALLATLLGDILLSASTLLLPAGYAALLIVAADTPWGQRWLTPLAAVGRLGLSVYLTQTLIFTTLFYGYGFGQAYRLGPTSVTVAAILIFTGQLMVSCWWIRRFRYGPAEWLWRLAAGGRHRTTTAAVAAASASEEPESSHA